MARSNIEYETKDSWKRLHELIDEYFTHFNNYIYRGHAQEDWVLEPTLTRALRRFYPDKREWQTVTKSHLDAFRLNVRGRCHLNLVSCSEDELWALGQSYGLYTPLLDWSQSPYVALFFALQGNCNCKKKERALWALNTTDIDTLNEGYLRKKQKSKSVNIVSPMTHENNRLVSQGGLYLKISVGTDIESWVVKGVHTGWITLYKINFPDSIRNDVIGALDNMNINHKSLFPDVGGASLHCNYAFEIEPYLELKRNELWKSEG
jgi:hypothetical protein